MRNSEPRELIIRYLLGALSAEEQRQYEESYFVDDHSFAELLEAERELIDRYVRGELSAHERKQFEVFFLRSGERRQKVELARSLVASIHAKPTRNLLWCVCARIRRFWR
jgi:anti-sigma factor RsiW